MTSMVIDFGGRSMDAVLAGFRAIIGPRELRILTVPSTGEAFLNFQEFNGTLNAALASISAGHSSAIQVEGTKDSWFLAGIYKPCFANSSLADWSGMAEGHRLDAESLFKTLQTIDDLAYIALSEEDSPDFQADHITPETFPWSDWRLRAAAVRDEDGAWIIRRSVTP